ncbi:SirB2 family protein [Gallaecimonas mangrovi]|uniref:SirB2 family protein n=1 Tax=Gallaecimonas mangrovi TaxID=2291597 RepID=UPI000E1FF061|nr:SirB2 family protein [Gallaecimonas mangrovi]
MDYLLVKQLHQALALVTVLFFIGRVLHGLVAPSPAPRWLKVAPHIIDTALLAVGVWLAWQLGQYPFKDNWLTAKVVALVLYIALGTIAIKRGRTAQTRVLAAIGAVLVFLYIVGVAVYKSPWSWLLAV